MQARDSAVNAKKLRRIVRRRFSAKVSSRRSSSGTTSYTERCGSISCIFRRIGSAGAQGSPEGRTIARRDDPGICNDLAVRIRGTFDELQLTLQLPRNAGRHQRSSAIFNTRHSTQRIENTFKPAAERRQVRSLRPTRTDPKRQNVTRIESRRYPAELLKTAQQ